MTARDQASRDPTPQQEHATRDKPASGQQAKPEQGVVKDERGQEQPNDKKRAAENR